MWILYNISKIRKIKLLLTTEVLQMFYKKMATFKAEVYTHQRKMDGTYNIKIRVTHNRKKKYISTVWYVTNSDISKTKSKSTFRIKNRLYIDLTDELIRRYRSVCAEMGDSIKYIDIDRLVEILTSDKKENKEFDFSEFILGEIEKMNAAGRNGNARSYLSALVSLQKYLGREKILVTDINVRTLNGWIEWLKNRTTTTTGHSTHNYLNRMRAMHNLAKKKHNDEEAGIILIPNSPFQHIDFPKPPVSRKRALSIEQIRAIYELPYQENNYSHIGVNRFSFAKDVFILSFVLVGMNAVDLYNCAEIKDWRITYNRTKTKGRRADRAEISIKIEPEFEWLIEKYRDPLGERVFGFYTMYSSVATFTTALNIGLKRIGSLLGIEDLEFYSARHSWATIALNDVGIDKYTVHACLNHVDESMKVTDIYIKKSWKHIDEANAKVLDFVFGK